MKLQTSLFSCFPSLTGSENMPGDESKRPRKLTNPVFQGTTNLVQEGQDFKPGDFVVLKEDALRENAPIWRYVVFLAKNHPQSFDFQLFYCRFDTRTLLQRYNPEQRENGEYLHKSANLFSGFVSCNRDRYVSVSVKYLFSECDFCVVKVVGRGIVKTLNP